MNSALIAIGIRNEDLERKAIEIAREIGKVHVDHGATSCKTPDAESYIKKREKELQKESEIRKGNGYESNGSGKSIITSHFPNCDVALLGGSVARGKRQNI